MLGFRVLVRRMLGRSPNRESSRPTPAASSSAADSSASASSDSSDSSSDSESDMSSEASSPLSSSSSSSGAGVELHELVLRFRPRLLLLGDSSQEQSSDEHMSDSSGGAECSEDCGEEEAIDEYGEPPVDDAEEAEALELEEQHARSSGNGVEADADGEEAASNGEVEAEGEEDAVEADEQEEEANKKEAASSSNASSSSHSSSVESELAALYSKAASLHRRLHRQRRVVESAASEYQRLFNRAVSTHAQIASLQSCSRNRNRNPRSRSRKRKHSTDEEEEDDERESAWSAAASSSEDEGRPAKRQDVRNERRRSSAAPHAVDATESDGLQAQTTSTDAKSSGSTEAKDAANSNPEAAQTSSSSQLTEALAPSECSSSSDSSSQKSTQEEASMRELCHTVLQLLRSRCDSKLVEPIKQLAVACRAESAARIMLAEGVLPKLLRLLKNTTLPELQAECSRLVAIFTSHASACSACPRAVVDSGGVPILLRLLKAKSEQVCNDALLALGYIPLGGAELCSKLIASGVPAALVALYRDGMSHNLARILAWACANLTYFQQEKHVAATWPLLSVLERLLEQDDSELLSDALVALNNFAISAADGESSKACYARLLQHQTLLRRTAELLSHADAAVVDSAALVFGNLFEGDSKMASRALTICGGVVGTLIGALKRHPNPPAASSLCYALGQLTAGTTAQARAVFDALPMPLVASLLSHSDAKTRSDAALMLCYGADTNAARVIDDALMHRMQEGGVIQPLCALVDPHSSDTNLQQLVLNTVCSVLLTASKDDSFRAVAAQVHGCGVREQAEQMRARSNNDVVTRPALALLRLIDEQTP